MFKYREYKYSTQAGKNIVKRAEMWEGPDLQSVYEKPSYAKQEAFDKCWEEYSNMENSEMFGICSHNTYAFTCSWYATVNGEPVCCFITRDNNYMVWLEK